MRHMKNKNYLLVFIVLHIALIVINIVFGYFVFLFDFFAFFVFCKRLSCCKFIIFRKKHKKQIIVFIADFYYYMDGNSY